MILRTCFLFLLPVLSLPVFGQVRLPVYPDSIFSTYYQQRVTHFRLLPKRKNAIVFLGNSITDGGEWDELFGDDHIINRGISGDFTAGVINRLDEVTSRQPAKIFLLIGINDLARKTTPDSVVHNILLIADYIRQQSPATRLFIQSILPVNAVYKKFTTHTNKAAEINRVNSLLEKNAASHNYTYINIHDAFCDADGNMNARLTNDGLHLKGQGYLLWKHLIYPYVFGLHQRPALIPIPKTLRWEDGLCPIYQCKTIKIKGDKLRAEAGYLQNALADKGINTQVDHGEGKGPVIELAIGKVSCPGLTDEAYDLTVDKQKVMITANTPYGIFDGIQTLLQLLRDSVIVDDCDITDWPAFKWRGYMVDVGRNFQSVKLLEQQIDKMALYKLNVFHLHLTEDIAWRIQLKQFPQLTDPQNMLRDKGRFYSEDDIKQLMNYCQERHVEFVPEIDMPGHSAAFKRCFNVDMQSEAGMGILKNILKEVLETYHFKYLHIGGDEVKITNPDFLPEMIKFVHRYHVQTIGWSPGGNLPKGTILQLWSGKEAFDGHTEYIDSRHLYLNHMDPLESVVTIFNRQLDNEPRGDVSHIGAEICLWNDRAVNCEQDLLKMNPVYPAMLAFGERSWCGGGEPGWTAVIGAPGSERANAFREFENRLLDQRKESFSGLPFPYRKQSNMVWKLYGPYQNNGDLSVSFAPEGKGSDSLAPALTVTGGTVILRHWWYPLVQGAISDPQQNTTWYATTRIWRDEDKAEGFWIGFNNLSRSYATDSPAAGHWDQRESMVWVNGNLISAPLWKHADQKGSMETPLIDEGYAYRKSIIISLKKGWNTILIKLPVCSFKGPDWNNPVKWMFTFVPSY
ncbi:MAG: family 20 glycosylhydrolase [Bacteroidetes bacterium]|nr:family 20 glycosylhydrolase [Bacteroidota bacterium]